MLQSVLPLNYDKRRPPTQPRLVPLPQGCTAAGTAGAAASRHHGATSDKLHRGGSRFQRCKCQAEAFAHRWNKHGRFPIKNITTELKSFKPTSPPASGQCSRRFGISHGASSKKGASAAEAAFSGETGSEAGFTIRPTKKTCPKKKPLGGQCSPCFAVSLRASFKNGTSETEAGMSAEPGNQRARTNRASDKIGTEQPLISGQCSKLSVTSGRHCKRGAQNRSRLF